MIISHAGDGNFHVVILFDPLNDEELREVRNLTDGMVNTALLMEGTCTGEHGIGVGKMKYLEKELGREALMTMGSIKRALDPTNLMNPGKVVPEKYCY
jgi:D-lactate dehydrogenase (cytochrome)